MASYTPNYNLKKPADSDSYDIADHNGNMDKIDTALNTLNSNYTALKKIKTKYYEMQSSGDSIGFSVLGIPNGSFISALVTNVNYIVAVPYTYAGQTNQYLGFINLSSMGSRASGQYNLYIVYFE